MGRFPLILLAFFLILLPSVAGASDGPSGSTGDAPLSGSSADYNGDGFADLAVGTPFETVSGEVLAGAVNVLYGTANGLSAERSQLWHQDRSGILDQVEEGDIFGHSLAPADYNGDGYTDLAIGARGEDAGGKILAGAVNVLYGSASGLSAAGNQFWHRDSPGILGEASIREEFAFSMTAGDFNGDGFADLAAGTPLSQVGSHSYAGNASVLYGSPQGLSANRNQLWTQDVPEVEEEVEHDDGFASFLVAGDFDGDGRSDLAVGVGHESVGHLEHAGAVNLLYGSSKGLSAARDQLWHQDSPGIEGEAEHEDAFGWFGMTAGDFNGDGIEDLAVGVPEEQVRFELHAGSMNVLYGSKAGLSADGNQLWNQASAGVESEPRLLDRFGYDLASGDFNGDGYFDVAVGVLGERVSVNSAGAVNVLYGGPSGLSAAGNQFWNQDSPGIADYPEDGDYFSWTVAAADWGAGSQTDLAIATPYEGIVGDDGFEGAVHVLYGSPGSGLSSSGSQFWHQGVPGIKGDLEFNDFFGLELS